jgi:MFS family permease
MIGRFLCGASAGCYCFIVPIYVGEITSKEIRGSVLSLFQVCLNLGVLFVFSVGNFVDVQILNVICASITILYTLMFLILPESPVMLISQNRDNEAKQSLKKLRGVNYNFDTEFNTLKKQNEDSKQHKKSFVEVFQTKSTKKAFIIIMLQFFFFQMSGINVVLFYSTTIFIEAGINLDAGIASIIVSSVQVISILFAILLVDRFGRKIMLSFSNTLMCFGLTGIGSYFTLKSMIEVESLRWLPLFSLCLFMVGFSAGNLSNFELILEFLIFACFRHGPRQLHSPW